MKNNYYVYVFLDPNKGNKNYENYHFEGEPFYVGKGKGQRIDHHEEMCFKKTTMYNGFFYKKLRKMIRKNYNYTKLIYRSNLSEIDAYSLEIELIKIIGRRSLKEGPLTNIREGGQGAKDGKRAYKKIDVFDDKGNFIETMKSITNTSLKYKLSVAQICRLVRGSRQFSNSGYIFKYYSKNKEIEIVERKKITGKTREIIQLTKEDIFVKEWRCASDIEDALGISGSAITNCCVGATKTSGKFKWKYK